MDRHEQEAIQRHYAALRRQVVHNYRVLADSERILAEWWATYALPGTQVEYINTHREKVAGYVLFHPPRRHGTVQICIVEENNRIADVRCSMLTPRFDLPPTIIQESTNV